MERVQIESLLLSVNWNLCIHKCNVDLIKGNEYRILYPLPVRGRQELIVSANGVEVAGSPFPVFVSIHPTQLGKPVRVITGVKSPRYLVINSVGEIIVTKHYNGVVVYDKELREGDKLNVLHYCMVYL